MDNFFSVFVIFALIGTLGADDKAEIKKKNEVRDFLAKKKQKTQELRSHSRLVSSQYGQWQLQVSMQELWHLKALKMIFFVAYSS